MLHEIQIRKAEKAVNEVRRGSMALKQIENANFILKKGFVYHGCELEYNMIGDLENEAEAAPSEKFILFLQER